MGPEVAGTGVLGLSVGQVLVSRRLEGTGALGGGSLQGLTGWHRHRRGCHMWLIPLVVQGGAGRGHRLALLPSSSHPPDGRLAGELSFLGCGRV